MSILQERSRKKSCNFKPIASCLHRLEIASLARDAHLVMTRAAAQPNQIRAANHVHLTAWKKSLL
jgi:hypothetical protein